MKSFKFLILIIIAFFIGAPLFTNAGIGIGIGNGRVQIEEELKAGGAYQLPLLPIINTGDETSSYEVTVEYHENIPQLRPNRDWFSFSPQNFTLEPGGIQKVNVILNLPAKTQPGEYFAYLEGHPIKNTADGLSSIGIAAATKLYFTVAPANIFEGAYYFFLRIFNHFMPWSLIIVIIITLITLVTILLKRFSFNIERK